MPLILRNVKGSKLTIAEMDGNFTYLEGISGQGGASNLRNLTNADNGITLEVTDTIIFLTMNFGSISLYLQDPSVMPGETIHIFRTDDSGYESYVTFYGTFQNDATYYWMGGSSNARVDFTSNGIAWYISNQVT